MVVAGFLHPPGVFEIPADHQISLTTPELRTIFLLLWREANMKKVLKELISTKSLLTEEC